MIIKDLNKDGNFLPSVINLSHSIPADFSFHNNYNLRHPKIIANRSIQRVFKSFDKVLNEQNLILERLDLLNQKNLDNGYLSELIYDLLSSILSYIEDCLHILKSGTPKENKKSLFVSNWLEINKHPTFKSFYKSIKKYRTEIANYVNEVKHNHGRIQVITSLNKEQNYLGYFMSEVEATDNNDTADTFNLNKIKTLKIELRYHLYQVYFISERLKDAYLKASNYYFNKIFPITQHSLEIKYCPEIFQRIIEERFYVFPPDIFTAKVYMKFNKEKLILEYPYGMNTENEKFVQAFKIENEEYPENRILIVPTRKMLMRIKNMKQGDKLNFIDSPDNVYKLTARTDFIDSKKTEFSKIEIEYDDNFKILYSSQINYSLDFLSGLISEKIKFYHFTNNN